MAAKIIKDCINEVVEEVFQHSDCSNIIVKKNRLQSIFLNLSNREIPFNELIDQLIYAINSLNLESEERRNILKRIRIDTTVDEFI